VPAWLPWVTIAATGAGTVLSYALLSEMFPKSASGRANGALNLLHVTAAFAIQYAIGPIVQQWASEDGHYPPEAYQAAFGLNLAVQAAAFLWFVRPERKTALQHLPEHPIHAFAASLAIAPSAALSYARARHAWSLRLARARAQQQAWRTAAFASFAVLALLVSSLASTVLGTSIAAQVIEGAAQPTGIGEFAGAGPQRPEHSFLLDRPANLLPTSLALGPPARPHAGREPW
jgi:MFS family permease